MAVLKCVVKTKNSVNAKDAMAPARTPTQCAPSSASQAALAKKVIFDLKPENVLQPVNALLKFNQNHS
jgi:hypothetical protein